jgi:hypothetical protein
VEENMQFSSRLSTSRGYLWEAVWVLGLCAVACAQNDASPNNEPGDNAGGEGGQGGGDMTSAGESGSGDNEGGAGGEATDGVGGEGGETNAEAGKGGAEMPTAGAGGMGGASVPVGGNQGSTTCQTNAVCDDFETYAPGAFKAANGWTVAVQGAGMVVDESRARSGKRSIKITVAAGGEGETAFMVHPESGPS